MSFDCFEAGSDIGGNWRYGNDNEMSSAYESLHINTSRQMMEYAAYPMPESLPDYPDHRQIAQYFDDFVDHFGLRETITFRTEVTRVEPLDEGYAVTIRSRDGDEPETRRYRDVVVANGHHWDPRWPEPSFPGAETLPRRADARALLPDPRPAGRQARPGARHRQLGLRHRRGVQPGRRLDRPGDAARCAHPAQVHVRRADRPPHRLTARAGAAEGAAAVAGRAAAAHPGQGHRLRPARARPRGAARAPDGEPGPAQPARPRRHHRAAEHRPVRGFEGLLHRRQRGGVRRRRLLHRLQGELPVLHRRGRATPRTTTSSSTVAWCTRTIRASTSSA